MIPTSFCRVSITVLLVLLVSGGAEAKVTFHPPLDNYDVIITDTYGTSRPGDRIHEGVDLRARTGTPVYAMANGVVKAAYNDPVAGNVVILQHSDGSEAYETHYYHLSRISVRTGESIRAQQKIGESGDSGSAAAGQPHLHLVVKRCDSEFFICKAIDFTDLLPIQPDPLYTPRTEVSEKEPNYRDLPVEERCNKYAENALKQNFENKIKNCGYKGNRWTNDFQGHKDWCVNQKPSLLEWEHSFREKLLKKCEERPGKSGMTGMIYKIQAGSYGGGTACLTEKGYDRVKNEGHKIEPTNVPCNYASD